MLDQAPAIGTVWYSLALNRKAEVVSHAYVMDLVVIELEWESRGRSSVHDDWYEAAIQRYFGYVMLWQWTNSIERSLLVPAHLKP